MTQSIWQNNSVQFPRLLCEIIASQELNIHAIAKSMDLRVEHVKELFDRANTAWEEAKNKIPSTITADEVEVGVPGKLVTLDGKNILGVSENMKITSRVLTARRKSDGTLKLLYDSEVVLHEEDTEPNRTEYGEIIFVTTSGDKVRESDVKLVPENKCVNT